MSAMMETRKSKGRFTFTLRSFDVAFPVKYPRARCPTAYVVCPSLVSHGLSSFLEQIQLSIAHVAIAADYVFYHDWVNEMIKS